MLERLAIWVQRRPRRILAGAAVAALLAGAFGASVSERLSPFGDEDPASQSVRARERFEAASGRELEPGVVALIDAPRVDVRSAAGEHLVNRVARELRAAPGISQVQSFFSTRDAAMVSRNGRSTYVAAYFKPLPDKRIEEDAKLIEARFAHQPHVRLGGMAIADAQTSAQVGHDLARAELLAFPLILALSLLFFRSLVAALLPPLLGALAIVGTFAALRLASGMLDISVFALNLVTGAGLGAAIDYSLFIVSRYREEAARSSFGAPALARTLTSAGRTVVFSSLTVTAAMATLLVFPQRFLYSMGIGGVIVTPLAALLALLVLPALLALLGPRVNAMAPRWLQRAGERDASPDHQGSWYRFSRFVMRRPARIAILSAVFLIALGIPFTGIKFVPSDPGVLPASASARQVSDALGHEFASNRTAPLEVLAGAPSRSTRIRGLVAKIARLPGVSGVAPAQPAGHQLALIGVGYAQPPFSPAAQALVRRVRALREPFYVGVAGQTASFVDLQQSLLAHLPLLLLIIVPATLGLLFLMTGSVLLPLKTLVMNLLTLSATFGILVWIFQDGHLQGLLAYRSQGALEVTEPVLLFAVAFGLATDYGMFLLSRIKEAHERGASTREAVARGLERTGRIVTAAALLFAVAVGALATSQLVFVKELGLGIALAVVIDASLIRALLVPSLMALVGELNWWAPKRRSPLLRAAKVDDAFDRGDDLSARSETV
jgi:uncharacterized membrane protein YdfJ with MMPL/SSD domain